MFSSICVSERLQARLSTIATATVRDKAFLLQFDEHLRGPLLPVVLSSELKKSRKKGSKVAAPQFSRWGRIVAQLENGVGDYAVETFML
jgi:hypothetical protein